MAEREGSGNVQSRSSLAGNSLMDWIFRSGRLSAIACNRLPPNGRRPQRDMNVVRGFRQSRGGKDIQAHPWHASEKILETVIA
jgi:hypothetical protein